MMSDKQGRQREDMDPTTDLASGFTVARYHELRPKLTSTAPDESDWQEVLNAVERRIQERFLEPIDTLARAFTQDNATIVPGFAILALDCLLIDTIQSFREGRISTGDVSPAQSFKTFLSSPGFAEFNKKDRDDFFHYVRNGILHNGETRGGWKIRIDPSAIIERDPATQTRKINRELFHNAVKAECDQLLTTLRAGKDPTAREHFLRRMDAIAGYPAIRRKHRYFAYGSNIDESEIHRTAPTAEFYATAFLPGYRLVFSKHSETRGGDAASITIDPTSIVWGAVYRVTDQDQEALRQREDGYQELPKTTVYLTPPIPGDDPTPTTAFTFIAKTTCPFHCRPPADYLGIIINAAETRKLPERYVEQLKTYEGFTTSNK